jgi:type IV secretory pathway TraG/TraD family ATPase VirD4
VAMLKIGTEKVNSLGAALFVIGLALLAYFDFHHLTAGISASLGVAVMVRQFLLARLVDVIAALIIFAGLFISFYWNLSTDIAVPILLAVGSIYYIIIQIAIYRQRRFVERSERARCEEAQLTIDGDEEH